MNNDFDAQQISNAANKELPNEFDEFEIQDLPPDTSSHHLLIALGHAKQRLLDEAKDVSRATLQNIWQSSDGAQSAESASRDGGEFELEISELPPSQRSHYLLLRLAHWRAILADLRHTRARKPASLSSSSQRSYLGRVLTIAGMCAVLLVLLVGNLPGLRAQFTNIFASTPKLVNNTDGSSNGNNEPIIVHHFGIPPSSYPQSSPGPLPSSCPQISTLQYFTTQLDPPGLGTSPIWLSGFTGPSAALDNLTPINAQVAHAKWPSGWYETLAVFIQKGFSENIVLKGASQGNGTQIWLSGTDPQVLGNTLTLNLGDGSHYLVSGQWEMTTISIAVQTAGCYTLQASWNNNSWVRYFAAGR